MRAIPCSPDLRGLGRTWLVVVLGLAAITGPAQADLEILSGACGELDTELVDASPHLLTTFAVVTACDYVDDGLSAGGQEILADDNLGGSSLYSEILAHELAFECEMATLLKTEGEILYLDPNGKKTDLLLEIDGSKIGVSVTRAIVFPPGTPLDPLTAETLLLDKLQDVILSSANVRPEDAWVKQILVVETPSTDDLELLVQTYEGLDAGVKADTITWMVQTDGEDEFLYFGPEPVCEATAVASTELQPLGARVFPNPFNPRTSIRFEMAGSGRAVVEVYTLRGERVCRLLDASLPAGRHELTWPGLDDRGRRLASGAYLLRLRAGSQEFHARLVLLK